MAKGKVPQKTMLKDFSDGIKDASWQNAQVFELTLNAGMEEVKKSLRQQLGDADRRVKASSLLEKLRRTSLKDFYAELLLQEIKIANSVAFGAKAEEALNDYVNDLKGNVQLAYYFLASRLTESNGKAYYCSVADRCLQSYFGRTSKPYVTPVPYLEQSSGIGEAPNGTER